MTDRRMKDRSMTGTHIPGTHMTETHTSIASTVRLMLCALIASSSAIPSRTVVAQELPTAAVTATITRARAQLDGGQGNAARNTMDSLVAALTPGSIDLVEALHWRAAMAERLPEAERDWKRLLIESPLSARAADALLRLSELEALRGQHELSRQHAERLLLDHAQSPMRSRAQLMIARSWFAQNNSDNGCTALASVGTADLIGETKLQADELTSRCSSNATVASRTTNAPNSPQASTSQRNSSQRAPDQKTVSNTATNAVSSTVSNTNKKGRYSVQLAAYARKADADDMVKRLQSMSVDARVDGNVAPFRVRTGYYETRASATAALETFTKRGMKGFVAELQQ